MIIDKPSPITGGLLELRTEMETVTFRGEVVTYEKSFYHCVDSGLDFEDDEMESANLKRIHDTYRSLHEIPTAEELKEMRRRYGIPSTAMSIILGLGENQFALYEDGTVPSLSTGRLLELAADPTIMRRMLKRARMSFSEKQYEKYYSAILSSMNPASYELEEAGLFDFLALDDFLARALPFKAETSSPRKEPYNEYCCYAGV